MTDTDKEHTWALSIPRPDGSWISSCVGIGCRAKMVWSPKKGKDDRLQVIGSEECGI